ncbi:MAG: YggT family protein [Solirubrobacteraceae bacterium]|jgi:YggT family protein|nr:YggT family protein [Solirubrobacteraceae bacterium]
MQVRQDIADFVSALFWVYTLCVLAYIVVSLVLSLGMRMPYSRPVHAILDFLRDVTEPFLRIFRRLGLQFGPFDLSPIIALVVLQLASRLIVGLIAP